MAIQTDIIAFSILDCVEEDGTLTQTFAFGINPKTKKYEFGIYCLRCDEVHSIPKDIFNLSMDSTQFSQSEFLTAILPLCNRLKGDKTYFSYNKFKCLKIKKRK